MRTARGISTLLIIIGGVSLLLIIGVALLFTQGQFITCRNWYGAPRAKARLAEGESAETEIQYLNLFTARFCIFDVNYISDPLFPETSIRFKIGFFDRYWKLHVYPGRAGGETLEGEPIGVGLCKPTDRGYECSIVTAQEATSNIQQSHFVQADIVFQDTAPWKGAEQTTKYQNVLSQLKDAIKTGSNFPQAPKANDFVIQIWQIKM